MPLTNTDADFWWLRYFCGLALPFVLAVWGIYSMISLHSHAIWSNSAMSGGFQVSFVPVQGKQAVVMGAAYIGMALALFANCYAQYHEKMAYYYEWILAPGAILAGGGVLWCSWIFLFR